SGADELYLLHAPDALRYRALTLPMVNVRYTLRAMRRAGHISEEEVRSMLAYMLTVPWFDRDSNCLSAAAYQACGHARSSRVQQKFDAMYRDIKREDARHVLAIL